MTSSPDIQTVLSISNNSIESLGGKSVGLCFKMLFAGKYKSSVMLCGVTIHENK